MSIVSNSVRTLATIRNVHTDIHREALRLAAVATPRVGRAGWAERQAEAILAQASKNIEAQRLARANEALGVVSDCLEAVQYDGAASHVGSLLPLRGDWDIMQAREALHSLYVRLGQAIHVTASDGRLADTVRTLLHSAGGVLYHRTQEALSDLVAYAAEAFDYKQEWLCSGCEEAGSIIPGHFACGF